MKVKTKYLRGIQLDWTMAMVQQEDVCVVINEGKPEIWWVSSVGTARPDLDEHGNPRFIRKGVPVSLFGCPYRFENFESLVQDYSITLRCMVGHGWVAFLDFGGSTAGSIKYRQSGNTAREAALRCVITQRYGEEVDVPAELV